jgi:hypothetical protein
LDFWVILDEVQYRVYRYSTTYVGWKLLFRHLWRLRYRVACSARYCSLAPLLKVHHFFAPRASQTDEIIHRIFQNLWFKISLFRNVDSKNTNWNKTNIQLFRNLGSKTLNFESYVPKSKKNLKNKLSLRNIASEMVFLGEFWCFRILQFE